MRDPGSWRKSSYSNGSGGACVEIAWHKSSHSNGTDSGNCVEVAWRKSSYSNGGGGNCVEVAFAEVVAVRDSKNSGGPMITITPASWQAFIGRFTVS